MGPQERHPKSNWKNITPTACEFFFKKKKQGKTSAVRVRQCGLSKDAARKNAFPAKTRNVGDRNKASRAERSFRIITLVASISSMGKNVMKGNMDAFTSSGNVPSGVSRRPGSHQLRVWNRRKSALLHREE